MSKISINIRRCKGCGYCIQVCPKKALSFSKARASTGYTPVEVNEELCIGCGSCFRVCPDYVFEIRD